jgi:RimJ/RimL family protein N-acetyltransferase
MKNKTMLEIPSQLLSERLVLRKYEKGDGKGFFNLLERNDNRNHLRESMDEAKTIKQVEDAEKNIRKHDHEWAGRERFVLGVWRKADNLFIGEIWIEPVNWEVPSFEIGWFIDHGYEGKGLVAEAANRALDFVFNDLNAFKIVANTRDTNTRSIKLAERVGLKREGYFRENKIENGKRYGTVHFGLLRREYKRTG